MRNESVRYEGSTALTAHVSLQHMLLYCEVVLDMHVSRVVRKHAQQIY